LLTPPLPGSKAGKQDSQAELQIRWDGLSWGPILLQRVKVVVAAAICEMITEGHVEGPARDFPCHYIAIPTAVLWTTLAGV